MILTFSLIRDSLVGFISRTLSFGEDWFKELILLFKLIVHPRKLRSVVAKFIIFDFSFETFKFLSERNSFILGISFNSRSLRLLLVTTKSSTYLVTQQPVNSFPKVVLCDVTP
jgi:hypothetical protein